MKQKEIDLHILFAELMGNMICLRYTLKMVKANSYIFVKLCMGMVMVSHI